MVYDMTHIKHIMAIKYRFFKELDSNFPPKENRSEIIQNFGRFSKMHRIITNMK